MVDRHLFSATGEPMHSSTTCSAFARASCRHAAQSDPGTKVCSCQLQQMPSHGSAQLSGQSCEHADSTTVRRTLHTCATPLRPSCRPTLLPKVVSGELKPSLVVTHVLPLEQAPKGFQMFNDKKDNCVKVVLRPGGNTTDKRPAASTAYAGVQADMK